MIQASSVEIDLEEELKQLATIGERTLTSALKEDFHTVEKVLRRGVCL